MGKSTKWPCSIAMLVYQRVLVNIVHIFTYSDRWAMKMINDVSGVDAPIFRGFSSCHKLFQRYQVVSIRFADCVKGWDQRLGYIFFPLHVVPLAFPAMSNFNRPGRWEAQRQSESVAYSFSQPDQGGQTSSAIFESAARLSFTELHHLWSLHLDWWVYFSTCLYSRSTCQNLPGYCKSGEKVMIFAHKHHLLFRLLIRFCCPVFRLGMILLFHDPMEDKERPGQIILFGSCERWSFVNYQTVRGHSYTYICYIYHIYIYRRCVCNCASLTRVRLGIQPSIYIY